MRQDVTSITASASKKLLSTCLSCSTAVLTVELTPSVTLEKKPERPVFASSSVLSPAWPLMVSVACLADSMDASMDAR